MSESYVLVLDTAMHACSVGLFGRKNGVIRSLFALSDPMTRGHQERIGPLVAEAFAKGGIAPQQLTAIGVTLGPGSFTGLRVGLAFAKGMASGLSVSLCGFSTLETLAAAAPFSGQRRLAAHEAGRGQVYVQYSGADDRADAPQALRLDEIDSLRDYDPEMIIGSGARHLAARFPEAQIIDEALPDLRAMAALCFERPDAYADLSPLYMREADAKVSDKAVIRFDF